MQPLISTIIAVYNGEQYLAEAIDSVLEQTLPSDEIIVINNASTDRTKEILDQYPQIKVYNQDEPSQWVSMNMGIDLAVGKYLTFLDADDMWLPDKNKLQLEFIQSNEEKDMVFCNCQQFVKNPDGQIVYKAAQNAVLQWGMMIEREKFLKIGKFDKTFQASFIHWFQNASLRGFTYDVLPQVLAYRRVHLSNVTHTDKYRYNLTMLANKLIHQRKNINQKNNL